MKWKCVIIDDHKLFNDGLELILKQSKRFGEINQIYDSRQAYHICTATEPDIVLVDYNMPHLNGVEVVKQLKSLQNQPKIVVISMYAEPKEIKYFQELGVNGFISKTIHGTDLISKLTLILKGGFFFETKQKLANKLNEDSFAKKHKLTKREVEVLKLLRKEYTTQQMADSMNISYYTVETHRKNINQKLKFETKQEFYEFIAKL